MDVFSTRSGDQPVQSERDATASLGFWNRFRLRVFTASMAFGLALVTSVLGIAEEPIDVVPTIVGRH
ncbi:MAG: hypothetical protein AAF664_12025, partial [Planctomycetota bacterium]